MSFGPEWEKTEKPLLDQLEAMAWETRIGNLEDPAQTGRSTFREVILRDELRAAIERINLRDGQPWLDDARISQAVSALERAAAGSPKLVEANQAATRLLLGGQTVEGLDDWDGGRSKKVHFIDWETPSNNRFLAISQFQVKCPGGQSQGHIRPDVTLFVNGIPLVVVECKSPTVSEPVASAIDQLRRYHNARQAAGEVDDAEGNEKLFHTNQFLVATSFDEARVGTIGADAQYYLEWKDTAPVSEEQVRAELEAAGGATVGDLSSQQRLVAGMLRPKHLLDIVRHFTLFKPSGAKLIKIVCRYQQFRAVQYAIGRLQTGKTKLEDGEHDRRGGIVWHTQGSGKSLTMVFLVRKMRSMADLRRFKIVVVTDRTDLQRQLAGTVQLTGETVQVAKTVRKVKEKLSLPGPGIVFAMIQKMRDRDLEDLDANEEVGDLGLLNDDDSILVMVDEAHRSHSSSLHANLLQALPNCARIGFTGTPIIMGQKKRTHDIFGEFIDRYSIREAEQDGATVPILYEGRTADGAVAGGGDLDQLFSDLFADQPSEVAEAAQRKWATKKAVLEAEKLVEAKAADILRHYVEHILPNGLKAQVVSISRQAAVRYQAAFEAARDELVAEAEALDEATRSLDDLELLSKPRKTRAAVRAWRELDLLKQLEFAAVISPSHNDPGEWAEWSDGTKIKMRTAHGGWFHRPLPGHDDDPDRCHPLAFLIVKSMLLTGFDAPIAGVMYLDRPIREAELLQAIARVNRTGFNKSAGIVVDYYGVARHLKEALSAYSEEDIEGALQSLSDEIPKLRDRHARVLGIFQSRGIDPIESQEEAIQLLEEEKLRAEFSVKLKQFLATLDLVLPRPEGLPFVRDARVLGEVYARARNRYREGLPPLGKSMGHKVQRLIDEHIVSLGIDPTIPPIAITDAKFADHVSRQVSDRAKASEMEHAVRSHIRKKIDEDPVHYQGLADRLEEILKKFGEDWEQLALALADFVHEVTQGRQKDDRLGLDPELHAPFFDLLREEREKDAPVGAADVKWLAGLTVKMVEGVLRPAVTLVGWDRPTRLESLRSDIFGFLVGSSDVFLGDHDGEEIVSFDRADAVADRLLELTRAKAERLRRNA